MNDKIHPDVPASPDRDHLLELMNLREVPEFIEDKIDGLRERQGRIAIRLGHKFLIGLKDD